MVLGVADGNVIMSLGPAARPVSHAGRKTRTVRVTVRLSHFPQNEANRPLRSPVAPSWHALSKAGSSTNPVVLVSDDAQVWGVL